VPQGEAREERALVDIDSPVPVPSGVLEAFWRYDAALLANDKSTLDELFLPGPDTLRGDGRNLLVGQPPQPASAACVTALQRAGAHLAGIAQTDEFASRASTPTSACTRR
jgi:hypothetical protein